MYTCMLLYNFRHHSCRMSVGEEDISLWNHLITSSLTTLCLCCPMEEDKVLVFESRHDLLERAIGHARENGNILDECHLNMASLVVFPKSRFQKSRRLLEILGSENTSAETIQQLWQHEIKAMRLLPAILEDPVASKNLVDASPSKVGDNKSRLLLDWVGLYLKEIVASRAWDVGVDFIKALWEQFQFPTEDMHPIRFDTFAPWDVQQICEHIAMLTAKYKTQPHKHALVNFLSLLLLTKLGDVYVSLSINVWCGSPGSGGAVDLEDQEPFLLLPTMWTAPLPMATTSTRTNKRKRNNSPPSEAPSTSPSSCDSGIITRTTSLTD